MNPSHDEYRVFLHDDSAGYLLCGVFLCRSWEHLAKKLSLGLYVDVLQFGQHNVADERKTMTLADRSIYSMTIQYELILIALELALIIYYIRKK